MAFCELKYFSKALGKQVAANLILPHIDAPGPYPVLYLLHGLSDDHTIWHRQTSIERYAADYPLIVVMPDGGRSFYCDAKEGDAWETAIIRDLIGYMDRMLPTRRGREGRCIGGLSMGGYGAIKLALKYPEMFCCAVSHSGALSRAHRSLPAKPTTSFEAELLRVYGPHPEGGPDDPFALAERLDPMKRPALRIDCGSDDRLLPDSREFHEHLAKLGYPHQYLEAPGGHEWSYWDLHVQEALEFHAHHLGIEKLKPVPRDPTRRQ